MGRFFYVIVLLWFSFSVVNGQDVGVTAGFDTTRIYIGDHVGYTITVEQPDNIIVTIPELKDTICGEVEILRGPETDTSFIGEDRLRIINRYIVTSFDSGFHYSYPIIAEVNDESGSGRFYSGYSRLEVSRVNIAPADTTSAIYDIIDPYEVPVTIDEVVPWILIALLLIAIGYGIYRLIYYFVRKNIEDGEEEAEVFREPAHIIAFRELEKLLEMNLLQKGEIKEYYSRLTEIIRRYADNRYGINSMEQTTRETLDSLVKVGFKKDKNYSVLKKILDESDLVKFAKYRPGNDEHEVYYTEAKQFVEDTMDRGEIIGENNEMVKKEVKS